MAQKLQLQRVAGKAPRTGIQRWAAEGTEGPSRPVFVMARQSAGNVARASVSRCAPRPGLLQVWCSSSQMVPARPASRKRRGRLRSFERLASSATPAFLQGSLRYKSMKRASLRSDIAR